MTSAPVPPQNLEAEESILGAILLGGENTLATVTEHVAPADFYRPSHGVLLAGALRMHAQGQPVDAITLAGHLEQTGELAGVGGRARLHELAALVPATANVRHYCEIVHEKALRRRVIDLGQQLVRDGFEARGQAPALVDEAAQRIYGLALERTRGDLSAVVPEPQAFLDRLEQRKKGENGTNLGFGSFDRMTTGLKPGQLLVLAAATSIGKTAFAVSSAYHVALVSGRPVALFTLEMSREEIADRLAAITARVELQQIRTGEIPDGDWSKLIDALRDVTASPLLVDDTPALSLAEARTKLRRLKLRQPGLALAVVDYLQLMTAPAGESRYDKVTEIARGLKQLAQDVGVPVMALSQLNRNPAMRSDKRPVLSDLRESGEIEQAADVVAFVHRESKDATEAELIVAKQRNGPTGTVPLRFVHRFARYTSAATEEGGRVVPFERRAA